MSRLSKLRLFALLIALLLPLALLIGCIPGGSSDDDDTTDPTDDDDTTDDVDDDDDDATPAPQGSVSGRVVDLAGAPLADIGISCCSEEMCLTASSGTTGDFSIVGLRANTFVVDNLGYPGSDPQAAAMDWSKFFEFVTVGEDEAVVLGKDLVLAEVDEHQQVSSGSNSLSYAGGLSVSFDGSAVDLPFLVADVDPLAVGAIELGEAAWPVGGLEGHDIVRAWAFAPFEVGLENGTFSVAITMSESFTQATNASLMWADYTEGVESEHFESSDATISADGLTVTGEVAKLSLLMLVTPSP
jgi:hypothetical protein